MDKSVYTQYIQYEVNVKCFHVTFVSMFSLKGRTIAFQAMML